MLAVSEPGVPGVLEQPQSTGAAGRENRGDDKEREEPLQGWTSGPLDKPKLLIR